MNKENMLFAEFVAKRIDSYPDKSSKWIIGNELNEIWHNVDSEEWSFNTSWDWLIPVWHKFRDLKFIEETNQKLHNNYVARLSQDLAYCNTAFEFFNKIKIAIMWYNSVKRKLI